VRVAHAYNPSYLEGRDQEDLGSRPAQANSLRDPILRKPITKKDWWSDPEFKPQSAKRKKKQKKRSTTPVYNPSS
jgi:hypothetical protein